ncbi:MAG: hypothetical protein M1281_11995 [Chloroflexi bacterium]|nr:hypothetical protein [Chloroflexota bacterium]
MRATSSGVGCGAHWPLSNGQVIPQSNQDADGAYIPRRSGVDWFCIAICSRSRQTAWSP